MCEVNSVKILLVNVNVIYLCCFNFVSVFQVF